MRLSIEGFKTVLLCLLISTCFVLLTTFIAPRLEPQSDIHHRIINIGTEREHPDIFMPITKFGNMEVVTGEDRTMLENNFASRLEEITAILERKLGNKSEAVNMSESVALIAKKDKYFEKLSRFPDIQTILLSVPKQKLPEILPTVQFYNFSTRNCSLLHKQNHYGATCTDDLQMTLNPVSWKERIRGLHIGLPKGEKPIGNPILTYMHIGTNGVVDSSGVVKFHNLTVVPHGCPNGGSLDRPNRDQPLPEYDKVFVASHSWGNNFYHNILEVLPRIASAVKFLQQYPEVKIHAPVYIEELFSMLGLPSSSKRIIRKRTVKAKIVYIPAGIPCGQPTLYNTQLLHSVLTQNLPKIPITQRDLLILIQRTKDHTRYFKNHDAILLMLQNMTKGTELSVEVFSDSSLPPLSKAAEMFNRALLVVAPHGAGEANMVFSQPGTILVEGICKHKKQGMNLCFAAMAQVLGLRYHGVYDPDSDCSFYTPEDFIEVVSFYVQHRHLLQ